ncbi:MAG: UDP-glucose 4-epimerase [uncultured Gemmatimonadetes bacterium]|uniref:UDP-glucose 4-epimerase n=1 Tax=uncultured Gemmatimonadota bacterium TaxID=203437 RepID=A0A6J4N3M5_9BACT|nr:MAG: UDP-glucose 4-epimerase [uncultured Gemmatimonadota bacterium]
MKRALVTGASGFVGRHALAPLAARGFEVHALSRGGAPAGLEVEGVAWHRADLLESGVARGVVEAVRPTHLLHLAWDVRPGVFWTAPDNLDWVAASLALARAFAETRGTRIVGAGTCAEYDWAAGGPCSEFDTPLAPATLYGAAKHALRGLVEAHARQAGVSAAWGRIFFLYGPYEAPARLVSSVARALVAGQPAEVTPGTQRRDFLHAADAGEAFAALLDSGVEGPVNVASGEAVEVREVVQEVARAAGRPDLVRWGARPAPVGEPAVLVADAGRLRAEVGWTPRHSLRSGVADAVAWWHAEAGR